MTTLYTLPTHTHAHTDTQAHTQRHAHTVLVKSEAVLWMAPETFWLRQLCHDIALWEVVKGTVHFLQLLVT